jgi:hypothetical protein
MSDGLLKLTARRRLFRSEEYEDRGDVGRGCRLR